MTTTDKWQEPWDEEDEDLLDDISIDETSTIDTETRYYLKLHEKAKKDDTDFYSYKRQVYDEDGWRQEKVEIYSTPILSNGYIRNAVSGKMMPHRIGSKYDDYYFRIMDVRGLGTTSKNNLPRKLFYEDPEQCERHLGLTISQTMKSEWIEKRRNIRSRK
jgi:hypothetical protein